jgi:hypothetical protein
MRRLRLALTMAAAAGLSGCDDGPETRQSFAQCQIEVREVWGEGFSVYDARLRICMQAKGFIIEPNFKYTEYLTCQGINYPGLEVKCYRRDSWFSELVAEVYAPRP